VQRNEGLHLQPLRVGVEKQNPRACALHLAREGRWRHGECFLDDEIGEITERRLGTYVLGDLACVANGTVPLEACAHAIAVWPAAARG
jgi:hypothetical protein